MFQIRAAMVLSFVSALNMGGPLAWGIQVTMEALDYKDDKHTGVVSQPTYIVSINKSCILRSVLFSKLALGIIMIILASAEFFVGISVSILGFRLYCKKKQSQTSAVSLIYQCSTLTHLLINN